MTLAPGRPKGGSDARARLIEAALSLFGNRAFQTISTREIAREAGVDASLIRYYFGSKSGLFEQMVRETIEPVLTRFRALSDIHSPDDIGDFMQIYYRAMAPNPGLPRLVLRVLQEDEGSEPYRIVLSVFSEVMQLSRRWFDEVFTRPGYLRQNVDSDFARLSLISLLVFPLIAPPVLMRQFGLTPDLESLLQLAKHNVEVIKQGLWHVDSRSQQ